MKEPIDILAPKLMILASAGSGKTFQLGNRVIGLVGARRVAPQKIVALTFTRKAAGEFADSMLSKLAVAASDPAAAASLDAQIGERVDVKHALREIVRALPRFQLGTMDSFFSRVVRGFQYELGLSGSFELIEGPQLKAATEEILHDLLRDALDEDGAEEFLHAFKRATMGREEQSVGRRLEGFLSLWHAIWKDGDFSRVGDELFAGLPTPEVWEEKKHQLAAGMRKGMEGANWTDKRQADGVEKLIAAFENHTIGSGTLDRAPALLAGLLATVAEGRELRSLKLYKEFSVDPMAAQWFVAAVKLVAQCELSAAVTRTRAVADLVSRFDAECERRLRRRGQLGFDDVKILLGRWEKNEEHRLRREAIDFRLDARFDHWLLDEFQDTSRAEWTGLVPLLDEVVAREEGSLFVVGDKKQAIYGWRGGDVRLFREVVRKYGSGVSDLKVVPMPESWRSADAVLDLVNLVCGDRDAIGRLFGDAMVERWEWDTHLSAKPSLTGESRVEVIREEDKNDRLLQLLEEIGVGKRELTCGILVRTNEQVRAIATLLRSHHIDVIEEGRRKPAQDNPVGVALAHLVRWLADPADRFAEEVMRMSPLEAVMVDGYGDDWDRAWEGLLAVAQERGFAAMAESVIEPLWSGLSEFGKRRAGDVIGALAEFDARGGTSPREASRWLDGLEVPQSPGTAAVQVMTIHKSKGLGFDVVILPEIEDRQVPNAGRFTVAQGEYGGRRWFLQPPAEWVRSLVPELREAQERWADDQRYEAMCVMYVALTRAKRGLYVLLSENTIKRGNADEFASPASWLAQSTGLQPDREMYQSGDPEWYRSLPKRIIQGKEAASLSLAPAEPMRQRRAPSQAKGELHPYASRQGMRYGSEMHRVWQQVGWVDEAASGARVEPGMKKLLNDPDIRPFFERRGRTMELYVEQSVEALHEGEWVSAVVDRLHVERNEEGEVTRLEILDFKTDAVCDEEELRLRYYGQISSYRLLLGRVYDVPSSKIHSYLLSTSLGRIVPVPF